MTKKERPSSGLLARVSSVGQGTWQMERDDRGFAVAALRRGIDLGLRHIDTAELYGSGVVEELVAEAIEGRRDQVFLTSKVLPQHASRSGTVRACDASLRRLRTDWIDLYLLHWPGDHPFEETAAAFEELCAAGKIRAYGVSNFDASDLERAVAIAGDGRIACNQVLYHLRERGIEHRVLPFCERHRIAVVGYSPFASGRFPGATTAGGKVLARIAEAHDATPHQIALAFLVQRHGVFTIPKSSCAKHVEENAGAMRVTLSDEDVSTIDEAFPVGPDRGGVPVL